ncbi:MAG: hypothetical protein ACFFDO_02785 [Candidatus Thorarchaeota archaeon]
MKNLVDKNIEIDDTTIYFTLYKLHKSYLLLISDQKNMGIGSVTLSSPPLIEGLKSTAASYNLFGVEKKLLSTIISEKASNILKAPVLLLLFLKIKKKEEEIAKPLMKFLIEILTDIAEK